MIIFNYIPDGNQYRVWLNDWPHDCFMLLSKEEWNALHIPELNRVFGFVDKTDAFFNGE